MKEGKGARFIDIEKITCESRKAGSWRESEGKWTLFEPRKRRKFASIPRWKRKGATFLC